jgi:hypothetical protein
MPASFAAGAQPELNFKVYSPTEGATQTEPAAPAQKSDKSGDSLWTSPETTPAQTPDAATTSSTPTTDAATTEVTSGAETAKTDEDGAKPSRKGKLLQGYIRVVPSGTKIPIIMDTAVDSDTSQEGDEFAARTGEDLDIDGSIVVPAGSVIKGRIAQLNAPKNLGRSGSVALKFDTVTTPDNRQIPLVATLVARGGVVHARRGVKDIAMDSGTVAIPALLGLGIGLLAGKSSSSTSSSGSTSKISKGMAGAIGAGVGLGIGVAILCIKKGKKIDVRPGDELKIELAEDLRMPM